VSSDLTRIRVETESPYDVVVGRGVLGRLAGLVDDQAQRVGVIHPQALSATGRAIRDDLAANGYDAYAIEVPDAEAGKTAEVAASCWRALGQGGFTRSDAVVGVGGGATTDLAGFVAATFLRGLRVIAVPTTLLGMVDAAVGGKTGINTAEGKNLVGAFHEPAAVLCDLALLDTLDPADVVSGLAEVVKCGFIADAAILPLVEADPAAAADTSSPVCRELIERAITVKARVVERDLREQASTGSDPGREALNYGHTLGHAIEHAERYTWRHGAAISVGMVFAAELGRSAGRLDSPTADRHRSVLSSLGLPTSYVGASWGTLHDAMLRDKKTRGSRLRFVILDGLARPAILDSPDPAILASAFAEVSPTGQR
jgi:3-dehydroquinate synthase